MFRNLVLSAAGAGLAACMAVAALQAVTTTPLILHAEEYEGAPAASTLPHPEAERAEAAAHSPDVTPEAPHPGDGENWAPSDGLERTLYTALANFVAAVAVSLMLLGAMIARGDPIDARRGLLWGAAGFVAASLLPSLGLPPELPGTPAAELLSRQIWWVGTALVSALGIFLLAFGGHWAMRVAGLALLVGPHIIGAPEPPSYEAAYPAALAGEFVIASIVVSAVLWSTSGLASGWLYQRLSRRG